MIALSSTILSSKSFLISALLNAASSDEFFLDLIAMGLQSGRRFGNVLTDSILEYHRERSFKGARGPSKCISSALCFFKMSCPK